MLSTQTDRGLGMDVARPKGLPGGDSQGGFAGSPRAGPALEIWKEKCVRSVGGREGAHGWEGGERKGTIRLELPLEAPQSDLTASFPPHLVSIAKGQSIHQALGIK